MGGILACLGESPAICGKSRGQSGPTAPNPIKSETARGTRTAALRQAPWGVAGVQLRSQNPLISVELQRLAFQQNRGLQGPSTLGLVSGFATY